MRNRSVLVFRGTNQDFKRYMADLLQVDKQIRELRVSVDEIVSRSELDADAYDRMLIALSQEISRRMDAQVGNAQGAAG